MRPLPGSQVAGLRGNRLVTAPLGPRTPRTHIPIGIGPKPERPPRDAPSGRIVFSDGLRRVEVAERRRPPTPPCRSQEAQHRCSAHPVSLPRSGASARRRSEPQIGHRRRHSSAAAHAPAVPHRESPRRLRDPPQAASRIQRLRPTLRILEREIQVVGERLPREGRLATLPRARQKQDGKRSGGRSPAVIHAGRIRSRSPAVIHAGRGRRSASLADPAPPAFGPPRRRSVRPAGSRGTVVRRGRPWPPGRAPVAGPGPESCAAGREGARRPFPALKGAATKQRPFPRPAA